MDNSAQLMAIQRANPGLVISDDIKRRVLAGTLVQVGVGSILPSGPVVVGGGKRLTDLGCIEYLQFQKSSEDLSYLIIDGNSYFGGNINEFREVLLDAALHMKCVSFCWDSKEREMTMLNVHPQCCCRCESHE